MGTFYGPNGPITTEKDYDVVKVVPEGFVLYHRDYPTSFVFFEGQTIKPKNGVIVNEPDSNWILEEKESYFSKYNIAPMSNDNSFDFFQELEAFHEEEQKEEDFVELTKDRLKEAFLKDSEQFDLQKFGIDKEGKISKDITTEQFFLLLGAVSLKAFGALYGNLLETLDEIDYKQFVKKVLSEPDKTKELYLSIYSLIETYFDTSKEVKSFLTSLSFQQLKALLLDEKETLIKNVKISENVLKNLQTKNELDFFKEKSFFNLKNLLFFIPKALFTLKNDTLIINDHLLQDLVKLDYFLKEVSPNYFGAFIATRALEAALSILFSSKSIIESLYESSVSPRGIIKSIIKRKLLNLEQSLDKKQIFQQHAEQEITKILTFYAFTRFISDEELENLLDLVLSHDEDGFIEFFNLKEYEFSKFLNSLSEGYQNISEDLLALIYGIESNQGIKLLVNKDFSSSRVERFLSEEERRNFLEVLDSRMLQGLIISALKNSRFTESFFFSGLLYLPQFFYTLPKQIKEKIIKALNRLVEESDDSHIETAVNTVKVAFNKHFQLPEEVEKAMLRIFENKENLGNLELVQNLFETAKKHIVKNLDRPDVVSSIIDALKLVQNSIEIEIYNGRSDISTLPGRLVEDFNFIYDLYDFFQDLIDEVESEDVKTYLNAFSSYLLTKEQKVSLEDSYLMRITFLNILPRALTIVSLKDEELYKSLFEDVNYLSSVFQKDSDIFITPKTFFVIDVVKKKLESFLSDIEDNKEEGKYILEAILHLISLKNQVINLTRFNFSGNKRRANFSSETLENRLLFANLIKELKRYEHFIKHFADEDLEISLLEHQNKVFFSITMKDGKVLVRGAPLPELLSGLVEEKYELGELYNYLFNKDLYELLENPAKFGFLEYYEKFIKFRYLPRYQHGIRTYSEIDEKTIRENAKGVFKLIEQNKLTEKKISSSQQRYDKALLEINLEDIEDASITWEKDVNSVEIADPIIHVKLKGKGYKIRLSQASLKPIIHAIYDYFKQKGKEINEDEVVKKLIEVYNRAKVKLGEGSFGELHLKKFYYIFTRDLSDFIEPEDTQNFIRYLAKHLIESSYKDLASISISSEDEFSFSSMGDFNYAGESLPDFSGIFISQYANKLFNKVIELFLDKDKIALLKAIEPYVSVRVHSEGPWFLATERTIMLSFLDIFSQYAKYRRSLNPQKKTVEFSKLIRLLEKSKDFIDSLNEKVRNLYLKNRTVRAVSSIQKTITEKFVEEGKEELVLPFTLAQSFTTNFMHELGHFLYHKYLEHYDKTPSIKTRYRGKRLIEFFERFHIPAIKALSDKLKDEFNIDIKDFVEYLLKTDLSSASLNDIYRIHDGIMEEISRAFKDDEEDSERENLADQEEKEENKETERFFNEFFDKHRLLNFYSLLVPEEIPSTTLEFIHLMGEERVKQAFPEYYEFFKEILEKALGTMIRE